MTRAALSLLGVLLVGIGSVHSTLVWRNISDTRALCNDFSQAGYFVRTNAGSGRWLVFLEGGGFCSSAASCNLRYFKDEVRTAGDTPADLWQRWQGQPANTFLSPLVTSVFFSGNSGTTTTEGRDLLDADCSRNPTFCEFNHVLIPYCSSDLWLLNDTRFDRAPGDFVYNPNSTGNIQFVFRGAQIFRSAMRELNIPTGSEVVLAGSSAGGVGALNHASWAKGLGFRVKVIMDSSWFVDFRGVLSSNFSNPNATALWLRASSGVDACQLTTPGFPCCVSAACVLTNFPPQVPVMAVTSLYDAYLLAGTLRTISPFSNDGVLSGVNVDFTTTLGEYGGVMNVTLDTARLVGGGQLSYYVTECSQHIYLDTSTLWGPGEVFGTGEVSVTLQGGVVLKQSIRSVWSNVSITTPTYGRLSIQRALSLWYNSSANISLQYRGTCYSFNCSGSCPDTLTADSSYRDYPIYKRSIIASLVLALTAVCVVTKLVLCGWLRRLEWRQESFLGSLATGKMENLQATVQFPVCTGKEAISVACLNVCYEVTTDLRARPQHHRDTSPPVVLTDPHPTDQDEVDEIFDEMCPDPTTLKQAYRKYTLPSESTEERIELRRITQSLSRKLNHKVKVGSKGRVKRNSGAQLLDGDPRSYSPPIRTMCCGAPRRKKEILKGVTLYFNPKQLTALMGPSGCGKTTLLDILTGRRKKGTISGDIYINGVPLEDLTDWYVSNTGYLLQSGSSYYEELTVRENLTLSSQIKLPQSYSLEDAFARVEQVMAMTDLLPFADVVVGTYNGPGLSGGQKRRLAVALQLLKLPSVIFLDEPTSGLDATSSQELLTTLNRLADSNRTVVLTIHQPRLEIFHMFHRLVVLSDGQIAYNGAPAKAYEVFVNALNTKYLSEGYIIPELENQNPADVIMDMLRTKDLCQVITDYYENTDEPKRVVEAIRNARNSQTIRPPVTAKEGFSYAFRGPKRNVNSRHAHWSSRLAAMEARAMKRASVLVAAYLPMFFLGYGILLGIAYYQTKQPPLVISGFCVYSVASALFMFPFLFLYYERALQVYGYEQADGAGKASDIVIQGFIRAIAMAAIPVVLCGGVLYILLVDSDLYSFPVFAQVMLVNMALNQTWVAILICVICAFPTMAFRISPVLASVAGFASGFFIPTEQMPNWLRFLFYINPNYYGFSASSNLLLRDFGPPCNQTSSGLSCLVSGSAYTLQKFNFDKINPYFNIAILLAFTIFYLLLATFCNWIRHNTFGSKVKRVRTVIRRVSMEHSLSTTNLDSTLNGFHSNSFNSYTIHHQDTPTAPRPSSLHLGPHEEVEDQWEPEDAGVMSDGYGDQPVVVMRKGYPKPDGLFLRDGESHNVWKPGNPEDQDLPRRRTTSPPESAPVGAMGGGSFFQRVDLWERQKEVVDRVQATQQALKHEMRELATSSLSLNIPPEPPTPVMHAPQGGTARHHSLRAVSMQVLDRLRKDKVRGSVHFHDVVKMCLEEQKLHTLSSGPLNGSMIQLQQNSSSPLHFFPVESPRTPWQVSGAPTATPTTVAPPPPITPKVPPVGPPPATPRVPLPITPRTPRPRAVPISIHKWREILQKEQGLDAISENTETEVSSNAELSPPVPSLKPCKRKNSISTVV